MMSYDVIYEFYFLFMGDVFWRKGNLESLKNLLTSKS